MDAKIRVTVWNEGRHEKKNEKVKKIYPHGIHGAIAKGLEATGAMACRTATLDEPEHGLTKEILAETEVLTWWGHCAHKEVSDEIVQRVRERVLEGMGLIVLHSGHYSKIFKTLLGTTCSLKWRDVGEKERIWVVEPGHPIAEGLGEYIELPHDEMYGEPFGIPTPDKLVFISWFEGGEVFRSGCCFERGNGRIFYFCAGHETYPIYYNETVIRVIANAVRWARQRSCIPNKCPNVKPLEEICSRPGKEM